MKPYCNNNTDDGDAFDGYMKMILLRRGLEQPNHNEKHYCNDNTDDENAFDGYEYDSSKERPGPETVYRGCLL